MRPSYARAARSLVPTPSKTVDQALFPWWDGEGRCLSGVSWTCLFASVQLAGWIKEYRHFRTAKSALHESSGRRLLRPLIASNSQTELRPVRKLRKKIAAANKLIFLSILWMYDWWKSLGELYSPFIHWENCVYEKIICFLYMSRHKECIYITYNYNIKSLYYIDLFLINLFSMC